MKNLIRVGLVIYGLILVGTTLWHRTQVEGGVATIWILYVVDPTGGYYQREIYRVRIDGKQPVNLTQGQGDNVAPFTSPRLNFITFMSNRDANDNDFNVYRMSFNGTNVKNLTPDLQTMSSPYVSPDGKWMVFTASPDSNLYRLDFRTEQLTQLTDSQEGYRTVDLSADSAWIFYTDYQNKLYRMRADGSAQESLTEVLGSVGVEISLSPDGEWLVYTSFRQGHKLYRSHLDGTALIELAEVDSEYVYPEITPDGQWVVFIDAEDIYRVRMDGTNLQNLTQSATSETAHLITPDGEWIVYSAYVDNSDELYRMRVDGSQKKRLTDDQLGATPIDSISAPARITQHIGLFMVGLGCVLGAIILGKRTWRQAR